MNETTMTKAKLSLSAAPRVAPLLVAVLLSLGAAASAGAQQELTRQQIERAMWTQLEILMLGVLDGDVERIDSATCLDDLLAFQLRKEEALGVIASASNPELIDIRRKALRDRATAFVKDLLERGGELEAIDAQRVETYAEELENVQGEGGQVLGIEAAGLLTLQLAKLDRPLDLNIYLLDGRWCVDPLGLPQP